VSTGSYLSETEEKAWKGLNPQQFEPALGRQQGETVVNLNWYAVQTYSCRERVVANNFLRKGICYYLPMLKERHRWSDRIKTVEVPLFKNYLFVKTVPLWEEFWKITCTKGVTRILGDEREPIPIPDKEISSIAQILTENVRPMLLSQLQAGHYVKVKSGPLKGLEGAFVKIKRRHHLAINISILGQSVLAEVDYCDVQPCD